LLREGKGIQVSDTYRWRYLGPLPSCSLTLAFAGDDVGSYDAGSASSRADQMAYLNVNARISTLMSYRPFNVAEWVIGSVLLMLEFMLGLLNAKEWP